MRDAIIILLVLSLSAIVPLLLRLINREGELDQSRDSTWWDGPDDEDNSEDPIDEEWPSVIRLEEPKPLSSAVDETVIATVVAQERVLRLL